MNDLKYYGINNKLIRIYTKRKAECVDEEMREKCDRIINDCQNHNEFIEHILKSIEPEEIRSVLQYRYIHGKKFFEIAEIMHYSERQVIRLWKSGMEYIRARGF